MQGAEKCLKLPVHCAVIEKNHSSFSADFGTAPRTDTVVSEWNFYGDNHLNRI